MIAYLRLESANKNDMGVWNNSRFGNSITEGLNGKVCRANTFIGLREDNLLRVTFMSWMLPRMSQLFTNFLYRRSSALRLLTLLARTQSRKPRTFNLLMMRHAVRIILLGIGCYKVYSFLVSTLLRPLPIARIVRPVIAACDDHVS